MRYLQLNRKTQKYDKMSVARSNSLKKVKNHRKKRKDSAITARVIELRDLSKIEKKPKTKKRIIKKPHLRKSSK